MKTEEYNKGHSFRMASATYKHVCSAVSQVPGVAFTKKRKFFWSGQDVGAEFTFRNHIFLINTDEWDGALWIMTKDQQAHCSEMEVLREAVEKYVIPQPQGAIIGFIKRILAETFT